MFGHFHEINILLLAYNLCIYTTQYCSIMVMKAAADGSFFKMRDSWFETHNAFCKGICITIFHSFPMWADHQDGVYFFLIL